VVFGVFASLAAVSSGGSLSWCDNPAKAGSMLSVYLSGVPAVLGPLIRSLEVSLTPTLAQSARGGRVSKSDVAWLTADPPFPVAGSQPWSSQGIEKPHPACGQGLLRISV
jgi:hypothetical protein